jgi:hypothetical protein
MRVEDNVDRRDMKKVEGNFIPRQQFVEATDLQCLRNGVLYGSWGGVGQGEGC